MEGRRPDRARLEEARRLFARAIETPGGLKIQTIHAFCERLLHLFPFEANVAARFEVLDDGDRRANSSPRRGGRCSRRRRATATGPLAARSALVNEIVSEDAFAELVARAMRLRRRLAGHDRAR